PPTFADRYAANNKPVTADLSLGGSDAGNYSVNPTYTDYASITPLELTVTADGVNRDYDATTQASVTLHGSQLPPDDIQFHYISAELHNKHAEANKQVTVSGITFSGADRDNYTLPNNLIVTTRASIAPIRLQVDAAVALPKTYDRTTVAEVTLSDNRLHGDDVTASYATASFSDWNVGSSKPVTVYGITITGADAGNYLANDRATTTGNITPYSLTARASQAYKLFDGTSSAGNAGIVITDDHFTGDNVVSSFTTALFASAFVGDWPVTVNGIYISGGDAQNYLL